ncbi:MAG: DegV family protein [bacterium]|nr:DegV family protein [bacterium]
MQEYILSCCSTADLTPEQLAAIDVEFIPFHFFVNGVQYDDDLGKSMTYKDFYNALRDGAETSTSQVNEGEFIDYFEKFLQNGQDILHVSLSSGISGVYNSACIARDELIKKYPERKIYVVDSLGASAGYGMLMDHLSTLRADGMGIDEIHEWVEAHKLNLHHWFFSTDLSFYVKGGRISSASGWFGTLLKICPLLNMDNLGRLIPRYKVRGMKLVKERIVKKMIEHAVDGIDYSGKVFISQSDCYEDALDVAKAIESKFAKMDGKVTINYVGTTIGSHTGPGTVALFFWGDERGE